MPQHDPSPRDRAFCARFESGHVPPAAFDHRAHVRLAYVYLADGDVDAAHERMRREVARFLERHRIETSKYHETLTRAWILAVRHFMELCGESRSADALIEADPRVVDSRVMRTHYSAERLFSQAARATFLEPDLDPIPRYGCQATRTSRRPDAGTV